MGIKETILQVVKLEIEALENLTGKIDQSFEEAVQLMMQAQRKIVVCGMGKSGHIAHKIAATLSSTGTPAIALHPAESLHGDLGVVEENDTLILLSKSGESDEIIGMLPTLQRLKCKLILITANTSSTLSKYADIVLHTPIKKEACTLDLAPTCSTTAALVVGDALAVSLMNIKGFTRDNFALYHPAGRIGKRLLFKVDDLMRSGQDNPVIDKDGNFEEVVKTISKGGANAVSVIDKSGAFQGLITGYDLRKAFEGDQNLKNLTAGDIMFPNPITIRKGVLATKAFEIMKNNLQPLNLLPVLEKNIVVGIITLQDMIRAGL